MPTYGSITSRLVSDSSVRLFTAPYVIPNGPATMSNFPFNYFPGACDQPIVSSALKFDAGNPTKVNGLQLRDLTPTEYLLGNVGDAVDSGNAMSFTPPAGASVWGDLYAISFIQWISGIVYTKSGTVSFPSSVGAQNMASIADVLGFGDSSASYAPQAIKWQGTDYMTMYALPVSAAEPRMLLGDGDGNLSWQTVWSGGDPAAGIHAPMWYPDPGDGYNRAIQGGIVSTVRPSIVRAPSAALGAEFYDYITLDDAGFDTDFRAAAQVTGPDQPYCQVRPEGFVFNTNSGYFIILSPDASTYSVVRPVPGDATAATIINEALFSSFATYARVQGGPIYMMMPGTWGGTPDLAVLTSVAPSSSPTPPVVQPVSLGRWRGQCGINWLGLALVGDAFMNLVGRSDFSLFTEYGNRLEFLVTTPPIQSDRLRIFISLLEIQMEVGQGEPADPSAAPFMMLDYSKDGGKTWTTLQQFRSMGAIGEYLKRLRWVNVGQSREWVFRFRYTGGARPAIIGTYVNRYRGLG